MKEVPWKVQRAEESENQLIGLQESGSKDTKANPDNRVVNIPISETEEYKRSGCKRRMNMWFFFRVLRDEFDKIDQDSETRVSGIGCRKV